MGARLAMIPSSLSDTLYDTMAVRATNRINARLDDELAQKVRLVRKRTRRSVSQIVKESLVRYCDEELGQSGEPLAILKNAGFIGCADGPADLSTSYKAEVAQSLRRKTKT
jgi:hypothetical protein